MLKHLEKDPILKPIIDQIELKQINLETPDVYYNLLESIVSQQLSVKAADTIFNRFLALFPDKYPQAELLLQLDLLQLRGVGLSQQKASYMQNVAQFALDKGMEAEKISEMTDSEVISYLTQIKGVGKWTVEMILMFSLQRPDIFPMDDLGIQQAMIRLYNLTSTGKELKAEMLKIAENWQPYRTLACRYLWRWKDSKVVSSV